MIRTLRPATRLLASTALAASLGACKIDNRPLLARGPDAAPATALPDPGPLAPAAYAPAGYAPNAYAPGPYGPEGYVQPAQAYVYPARAYALRQRVYDAPPAYAFDYGGVEPWVWEAPDEGEMFAEPIDDGYRYYYYEPGAAYPYFVQDPGYAYAYGPDGALIALFDAAGVLLAADDYPRYAPHARDYWRRGYDLDQVFMRSPRRPAPEPVWRERGPRVWGGSEPFFRDVQRQPAWREAAERYDRRGGPGPGWHGGPQIAAAAGGVAAGALAGAYLGHRAHGGRGPAEAWRGGPPPDRRGPGRQAFAAAPPHGPPADRGWAHGDGRGHGGREFANLEHRGGPPAGWRGGRGPDRGGPVEVVHGGGQPHGWGGPQPHGGGGPPRGWGGPPHGGGGPQFHMAQAAPQPHGGGGGPHGGGGGGGPHGGGGGPPHGGGGRGGGGPHGGGGGGHGGGGGGHGKH